MGYTIIITGQGPVFSDKKENNADAIVTLLLNTLKAKGHTDVKAKVMQSVADSVDITPSSEYDVEGARDLHEHQKNEKNKAKKQEREEKKAEKKAKGKTKAKKGERGGEEEEEEQEDNLEDIGDLKGKEPAGGVEKEIAQQPEPNPTPELGSEPTPAEEEPAI